MKILAPIREAAELEMLLASGAEELFCGYVPASWTERYGGAAWLNRRSPKGGSFGDLSELRSTADAARRSGVPVFATLNAPYYTEEQLPDVIRLAEQLSEEAGITALIVSDVNLLALLSERRLSAALHVSSVAASLNAEAIRFLLQFGATRVVLPRSLTVSEIRGVVQALRDEVEIEVFMLNDGCAFEEGFCATTHHHSVGAFCTSLSGMETEFEWTGPYFSERRRRWLRANLADYREWVWYLNGNGCATTSKGLPYGPCGLCAIPDFARMGVASLKIVGREASVLKKMASVRMVRDIVDRVRGGHPKLHVIERARALRAEPVHCNSGYMCYYRVNSAE